MGLLIKLERLEGERNWTPYMFVTISFEKNHGKLVWGFGS